MEGLLFTDGGARGNPGASAIAALVYSKDKQLLSFDAKYIGTATNNMAEYEALILGLEIALLEHVTDLSCFLDSELVVKQLNGEYRIKDDKIVLYKQRVDGLTGRFASVKFTHVRREQNKFADKLVNIVLDSRNQ